jgi:hypothetical protein
MTEAAHAPIYEEKEEPRIMLTPGAAHYLLGLSDLDRDDSVGKALSEVASGQQPESLADAYVRTAHHAVLSDSIMDELTSLGLAEEAVQ